MSGAEGLLALGGMAAMVVSYASAGAIRRWALYRHLLDIPNERSLHRVPTPRGGGLAFVIVTLIGLLAYARLNPAVPISTLAAYLMGAVFVLGVSWLDDLYSVPNRWRFTVHCLGAVTVVLTLGYWDSVSLPFLGHFHLGWLGVPVTFLWIVGLTNAYNFMDGIDGIAGGQAVVAGLGWALLGWLTDQWLVSALGLFLAATNLGFLGHNWPPARLFMGDVGSAFLGYTFAVLAVIAAQMNSSMALSGVLMVWPFVFDTVFTLLRRLRNGENVFTAHRSHLYQRLVAIGYAHGVVTVLYIGLAAIGALLALAWSQVTAASSFLVGLTLPVLCSGLWAFVRHQEHARARWRDPRPPCAGGG